MTWTGHPICAGRSQRRRPTGSVVLSRRDHSQPDLPGATGVPPDEAGQLRSARDEVGGWQTGEQGHGLAGLVSQADTIARVEQALPFVDAVDRALFDAASVQHVDARLGDDVGHPLLLSVRSRWTMCEFIGQLNSLPVSYTHLTLPTKRI